MLISKAMFLKINNLIPQIGHRCGVKVGISAGEWMFIEDNDDFVLFEDGEGNFAIVDHNEYNYQDEGILCVDTTDPDQKSERITDFLINLHLWIKDGVLVEYPEIKVDNIIYQMVGDEKDNVATTEFFDGGKSFGCEPFSNLPVEVQRLLK